MTNSEKLEIQAYIDDTVKKTVQELKKNGLINADPKNGYEETVSKLRAYYQSDKDDESITKALDTLKDDVYFDIIPLYYLSNQTIEHIASMYNVDTSTITRNKKRLCMEIYKLITIID